MIHMISLGNRNEKKNKGTLRNKTNYLGFPQAVTFRIQFRLVEANLSGFLVIGLISHLLRGEDLVPVDSSVLFAKHRL